MSSAVRSWRTAFLTLRDEALASPPLATVLRLLNQLILFQSESLIAAVPDLPRDEVTSDLMLLMELARDISHFEGIEDVIQSFTKLSHLIHDISNCSVLEINVAFWALMLESFERIVFILLGEAKTGSMLIGNMVKATKECLETVRFLFGIYQAADLVLENEKLLKLVLLVLEHLQVESVHSSYLSDDPTVSVGVWEVQTITFGIIGEVYLKVGSSLSVNIWKSTIEVLRKVMDICASRSLVIEDNNIAMFYTELLHCLHLVLSEPRGYLADHVAGFVASLRIFLCYGLVNNSHIKNQANNHEKEVSVRSQKKTFELSDSDRSRSGPYRPPHLRRKVVAHHKGEEGLISAKQELITSDSECCECDGSLTDNCAGLFVEARLAAILCIQDLCRADPKLFTSQWTMLLPSTDVLQHKKYETTLLNCFLYDPYLKVRIAAGSAMVVMLDGPATVSLQVAEFKEHSKCGSFTPFSISLGHILMQLHSGTLDVIKRETNRKLLELTFKILVLLVSSTPYSRMSADLLSVVISSIQSRIEYQFSFQSDQNGLLAPAINCLTTALSVSPPSACVNNMLLGELSTGSSGGHLRSGVLHTLFRYSGQFSSPSISIEAFQALKALAHNYPNAIVLCWKQVSSVVSGVFSSFSDSYLRAWKGNTENTATQLQERVMAAAIKVLDECLRAISGFKGTEDLSNNKFLDSPFTSDYVKTKTIASAPLCSLEIPTSTEFESKACPLKSKEWFEAIVKHLPVIIKHFSPMVRAASVTCFAGMTSSVFSSLPKDKQEFVISSLIDAALNDEIPSVRSAACRAIGVVACFPQIYQRTSALENFFHALKHNALDSLVSVRVTASWALANICDAIGHYMDTTGRDSGRGSEFILSLVACAMRLARDNDKVKANSVRALGNLSRFIHFTNQPPVHGDLVDFLHLEIEDNGPMKGSSTAFPTTSTLSFYWLEQMVQTFLSCMTTGNVKVQWNVCHALSNLFFNRTLKLQDCDWTASVFSILLLLLRDSSNFKIRIQAAAALAVPETVNDYGRSYYDIVKTVANVIENFKSSQISCPSNFKYLIALEKQLTSTMLHLLGLASRCDHQATHEFFIMKAMFLEGWIEDLCSSFGEASREVAYVTPMDKKKDIIFRTILSLVQVFENSNHHVLAQKFCRLQSLVKNL